MKKALIFFGVMVISCSKNIRAQNCNCDQNYHRLVHVEYKDFTKNDIIDLFCCINKDLEKNAEISEVLNEMIFNVLKVKTDLFLLVGSQIQHDDRKILFDIIENPLVEENINEIIEKVKNSNQSSPFKQEILRSLLKIQNN